MADLSANPDNLIPFFERVASNQKANIAKFPAAYDLIQRVNICLSTAGKNLINPKPVMAGVLCLRCQYAFKAAAGMALARQVVETFVMMRSCLEYAGYALAMFHDSGLESVFMSRHLSAQEMQVQKQKFRINEVKKIIEIFDPKLADVFSDLYERAIDFGGHPNPHAVMSAVELPAEASDPSFMPVALSTDEKVLRHAMRSVAQVGLAVLFIFQHIFKAKFELLGIRDEMDRLRREKLYIGRAIPYRDSHP
jgi:hypothetical protein